jgi:hypothetical protein
VPYTRRREAMRVRLLAGMSGGAGPSGQAGEGGDAVALMGMAGGVTAVGPDQMASAGSAKAVVSQWRESTSVASS